MGKEFIATTLEELCDLMCGNIIPKEGSMEVNVVAEINNMPEIEETGFLVVRRYEDNEGRVSLWYYGCYERKEVADEVASEIGNGLVLEKRE